LWIEPSQSRQLAGPDYRRAGRVADGRMSDDQLSQHERTVLEVLEEGLALEDPAFAERFVADSQALNGTRRWWSPLWWLNHRHSRNLEP
jgi:Protein of unknown function (DUF3040)